LCVLEIIHVLRAAQPASPMRIFMGKTIHWHMPRCFEHLWGLIQKAACTKKGELLLREAQNILEIIISSSRIIALLSSTSTNGSPSNLFSSGSPPHEECAATSMQAEQRYAYTPHSWDALPPSCRLSSASRLCRITRAGMGLSAHH